MIEVGYLDKGFLQKGVNIISRLSPFKLWCYDLVYQILVTDCMDKKRYTLNDKYGVSNTLIIQEKNLSVLFRNELRVMYV